MSHASKRHTTVLLSVRPLQFFKGVTYLVANFYYCDEYQVWKHWCPTDKPTILTKSCRERKSSSFSKYVH